MEEVDVFINQSYHTWSVETDCERRPLSIIIICTVLTIIASVVSTVGNFAVILATYLDETLKVQTGNILIVSLALIDMLTGIFVMVPSVIALICDSWPLGVILCNVHFFFNYFCAGSSSVTLCLISVDRAIAILYPLHYPQKVTRTTAYLMGGFAYVFAIAMTATPSIYMGWVSFSYKEAVCSFDWELKDEFLLYMSFAFLIVYTIPLLLIIFCNWAIISSARKMNKNSVVPSMMNRGENQNNKKNNKKNPDESASKTTKSMMIITLLYFTMYSPYSFSKIIKSFVNDTELPLWYDSFTTVIIFYSSAVNPFVYGFLRNDYRNAFKKLPRLLRQAF